MLKIFSKRERAIFYMTVGIISFALCFNFILGPFLAKNDSLNKEISVAGAKLARHMRLLKQKDLIEAQLKQVSSSIAPSDGTGNPVVDALAEIESLASSAGVKIVEVRPQGSSAQGAQRQRSIDVRCEATIEGYFKFIYDLENSLSLLRIKSFQLTARPNSETIEAVFQLSQLEI